MYKQNPVDVDSNGCWIWNRARSTAGYGRVWQGGRIVQAHRLYYERKNGKIGEGLELDHLCRVHACVNPDHLEPVTHAENMRRSKNVKLTASQVSEILGLKGKLSQPKIARKYGIGHTAVHMIHTGQAWA